MSIKQRTLKVTIRYFFPKIGKFIGFTKFWEVILRHASETIPHWRQAAEDKAQRPPDHRTRKVLFIRKRGAAPFFVYTESQRRQE
jgi:hypothetical protein